MDCVIASAAAVAHGFFLRSGYHAILSGTDDTISSTAPVVLPLAYLAMVFGGNALMSSRAPFTVKGGMAVYNLYATALSAAMLLLLGQELVRGLPALWTQPWDTPNASRAVRAAVWLNMQSKYVEFADTLFMVLRKKTGQISSLHVIHHAEMGPLMWLFLREASLNTAFGPAINSAIHVMMYSYYGMAGVGVRLPLMWKKTMTSLQMVQFVVILVHAVFHLAQGGRYWSTTLATVELLLMFQMLYMFGNFFVSSYGGKKAAKKE